MTAMLVDTPTAVVFCVGFLIVAAQSGRHERAQPNAPKAPNPQPPAQPAQHARPLETLNQHPWAVPLLFCALTLIWGASAEARFSKWHINQRPGPTEFKTPAASPTRDFCMPPYTAPVKMLTPVMLAAVQNVVDSTFGRVSRESYLKFDDVVIAQRDRQIVGVVFTRWDPVLDMHVLERFAVLSAYRNRGVGGELLEYLRAENRWNGAQALFVNSGEQHARLVKLYQRHDFNVSYSNSDETMLLRTVCPAPPADVGAAAP